jgi:hypothetical protein
MKLSAPVSSIFLLQPCRAHRHDLDETGLLIPGCWFEPTPLRASACCTILKTGHKIPCQKSQVGRAKWKKVLSRNEFASLDRRHRCCRKTTETECAAAPLPCWFKPTRSEVRIGWKDETEPKPESAGKRASPARPPGPKATNFCAESASARNPSRVPLPDESGKRILL